LASFEDFDSLHHVSWDRVERSGAVVQSIADANTVNQPENLVGPRSLERSSDVVERSRLGREKQAWNERLERLRDVVVAAVLDLRAGNDLRAHTSALDDLRQLLFEFGCDDADGLDDAGDFQHHCERRHGRRQRNCLHRRFESGCLDVEACGSHGHPVESECAVGAGARGSCRGSGVVQRYDCAVDRSSQGISHTAFDGDRLRQAKAWP
jgi:hypothetical protein